MKGHQYGQKGSAKEFRGLFRALAQSAFFSPGAAALLALFTDIGSWANGYGREVDLWGYGPYTGLSCNTLKAGSWSNLCHHPFTTKALTPGDSHHVMMRFVFPSSQTSKCQIRTNTQCGFCGKQPREGRSLSQRACIPMGE